MSFLEKKYIITTRNDRICSLTAKELYERILKDSSQSDYNWIAPARELVRICKISSFPAEYSIGIKIAILNCFANIEHGANCGGDRYYDHPADKDAVYYCYNSLYGIVMEDAISARKRFLTEMINTASHLRVLDCLYFVGPTYIKLREDWSKSKFEEYFSQEKIDFKQLVETLRSNFHEIVKTAESNGDFEEDKKKDQEEWKIFYERLNDIY